MDLYVDIKIDHKNAFLFNILYLDNIKFNA